MTSQNAIETEAQGIRLNRFLARCGLGSRRECEKFVLRGKITINGVTVKELATRVDPGKDQVLLDGKALTPPSQQLYLLFHKPQGVTVSRKGFGDKTVFDIVRGMPANLSYAGRLDRESEGLLLLTTDGMLIERATHPKFGVRKIYRALVRLPLDDKALERFRKGLPLDDGPTAPAQIDRIGEAPPAYRIVISEGRNRQIRRMLAYLGHPVERLIRTGFGPLRLGGLKSGEYRPLGERELQNLKDNLKLKSKRSDGRKEKGPPFRYPSNG